jgi:hypothetical protein
MAEVARRRVEVREDRVVFKTAGWSNQDELWFEPGGSECGHIMDGVSVGHDGNAGFVLDFKDLEKMYQLAVEKRHGSFRFATALAIAREILANPEKFTALLPESEY